MLIIDKERSKHAVSLLCRLVDISSNSYYHRCKNGNTTLRKREDEQLKDQIKSSWERSRCNYGSPRIVSDLRNTGIRTSRKRVNRLMREEGIQGRYNRRKKPLVTDSKHTERISQNLLKEMPFPDKPRKVIVTDTTYVWTDCGWHYLATVMDLFNREILGWSFSSQNDRHLVCKALWDAASALKGSDDIIHHSDRGSTYCSEKYRKLLKTLKMRSSMSAKGYCYDNAHMESFYGSMKCECPELQWSLSPKNVKLVLFDYIEGFYNTHRIHTALDSMSPRQFFEKSAAPMGAIGMKLTNQEQ